MKRISITIITVIIITGLLTSGCGKYKSYVPADQLTRKDNGKMEILTNDGTTFTLRKAYVSSSDITGHGIKYNPDGTSEAFSGSIMLSDISIVQAQKTDPFATWLAASAISFVLAGTLEATSGGNSESPYLDISISYPVSGGGWGWGWASCPYVFTYDGDEYHFESETFAGAICRGLERTNVETLKYIKPVDGTYSLVVANQSPESQHVNAISLVAVDHPSDTRIIPDALGNLHTLKDEHQPVSATSLAGEDVTGKILYEDKNYYESDINSIEFTSDEDLRDGIICSFQKPSDAKLGKLVINGINTTLGYFALEKLFSNRGPNKLSWYHQLNNDPRERKKLFDWIRREGWLEISIRQDDRWVPVNWMPDFGPRKASEKVALLNLSGIASDEFEIKLESATDLWRLDKVAIDYSPDENLDTTPLDLASALDGKNRDVFEYMATIDSSYFSTIPGDYAKLFFKANDNQTESKRTIILKTTGYYYSWINQKPEDNKELVDRILTEPLFGNRLHLPEWKEKKDLYTIYDGEPIFEDR